MVYISELGVQYIVEISCIYFYFSDHQRLLKMKHRTISVRIFPRKFVNIIKFGTYCEMLPTCSKATSVFMITRVFRMKPIFKELAVTKNIS